MAAGWSGRSSDVAGYLHVIAARPHFRLANEESPDPTLLLLGRQLTLGELSPATQTLT